MRTSHSHAQRFPAGRPARALAAAALASAVVSATLWSAGADTAALVCAEAGLVAVVLACRVWGRPAGRGERASVPAKFDGTAPAPAPVPDPAGVPEPACGDPDREPADAAFVGIARRIQATVNQELHDLRRMQDRHGDTPEVFGDLLRLDHGVSLIGRLADSLAVLGGAGPGRRRTRPVDLLDVVRGGLSRIVDYPRVDVEVSADVAVAAAAVEPVVHALAELLDNATRYSPPHTRVRVSAERVPAADGAGGSGGSGAGGADGDARGSGGVGGAGLLIVVEDAGVGLSAAVHRHIARVLSPDGTENGPVRPAGPPRLGLTVVGLLARSTGFEASVDPGANGGARATMRLPTSLVTAPAAAPAPVAAPAGAPARAERAPEPGPRPAAPRDPDAVGPTGLPQRRRAAAPPPSAAPAAAEPDDPAPAAGRWLGAFMGGKDGGGS